MDSIEANQHVMKVTPHTCSQPAGGPINSCDKSGTVIHSSSPSVGLCPSTSCAIDSRRPFIHEQRFLTDSSGKSLVEIENILIQNNRSYAFNATQNLEYLSKMSPVLGQGMVLTFQLWGESWLLMSWLDGLRCLGSCPLTSSVTYGNISLTTL